MLAVVNAAAGGGKGLARWRAAEPELRRRLGAFTTTFTSDADDARAALLRAIAQGETDILAAGGDGTVNLIASVLAEGNGVAHPHSLRLGAVGLGSSNDFHKPFRPDGFVAGVPVRLDFDHTVRHDVGCTRYRTAGGSWATRHWMLNASIGTTAEGNRLYNDGPVERVLKRLHPDAGMVGAALHALFTCGPRPLTLVFDDGAPIAARVTNLGIVKNPHFTGVLRYDSPYEPGSGMFDVHMLGDVSLLQRARVFVGLHRGRFGGQPGTTSWRARRLLVRAERPFAVEGDGEVVVTCEAEFSLRPRALELCT
jgi:diacylglycerol kinase (ATP)